MPDVFLNGYRTHYEDDDFSPGWRRSEVVLIQHGFGRNSAFWRHWVTRLAGDYRLIRRDLRGHGGSDNPVGLGWNFDALVGDLHDFVDALGLETVHLIGESTGGMLAAGFAHRFPDRLKSLTLCNAPTTIGPAGQAFFAGRHATWQDALAALGARGWIEWLLSQPGTAVTDSVEERAWVVDQMARTSTATMIGYSRVISETDVAPLLPGIDTPTLVLAPTRSAAAPLEGQRAIAAALPNGRLAVIDAKAHEVYWDRPDNRADAR